jgi:hypothetical protein
MSSCPVVHVEGLLVLHAINDFQDHGMCELQILSATDRR